MVQRGGSIRAATMAANGGKLILWVVRGIEYRVHWNQRKSATVECSVHHWPSFTSEKPQFHDRSLTPQCRTITSVYIEHWKYFSISLNIVFCKRYNICNVRRTLHMKGSNHLSRFNKVTISRIWRLSFITYDRCELYYSGDSSHGFKYFFIIYFVYNIPDLLAKL